ncbi:DegV family protein [Helcococcus sueciensis]|uniref:DegV family protein n=1 Tax=Helcococcus sueciensis TaxID=241555 RepID=UPI0004186B1C|nr:DegV family protein [Helcococcus sueciensis]
MTIRLIIDSASEYTLDEANKKGLDFIPLILNLEDKSYRDGIELTKNDFFDYLINKGAKPSTSQPSPHDYEEVFKNIVENGDKGICITISSEVSGTYQSAMLAREKYKDSIEVIDSRNATIGERILIDIAKDMIDEGLEFDQIVNKLNTIKNEIKVYGILDTLEYLKRGGRVSSVQSLIGGLFSIKPILSVVDGKVEMIDKSRGIKKGFNKLYEYIDIEGKDIDRIYFGYSGLDKTNLELFIENMKGVDKQQVNIIQLGTTIGTHAGPGGVVVAYY